MIRRFVLSFAVAATLFSGGCKSDEPANTNTTGTTTESSTGTSTETGTGSGTTTESGTGSGSTGG